MYFLRNLENCAAKLQSLALKLRTIIKSKLSRAPSRSDEFAQYRHLQSDPGRGCAISLYIAFIADSSPLLYMMQTYIYKLLHVKGERFLDTFPPVQRLIDLNLYIIRVLPRFERYKIVYRGFYTLPVISFRDVFRDESEKLLD